MEITGEGVRDVVGFPFEPLCVYSIMPASMYNDACFLAASIVVAMIHLK
jgi:hypothetical protein